MIYFDHNATSPLSRTAREAWLAATERYPANPSSPHRLGARAEAALQDARHAAAGWLGCSPLEIVWTSGATEANNALFYHAAKLPGEAWITAIEHPSVIQAARRWFEGRLQLIPVTPAGACDIGALADKLKTTRPALVAVMAANNETGVLQPWREVLQLCREQRIPFACDAAQWVGKLPAAGLGECDFVIGCAHKFGGPVGVGFMKAPANFIPFLLGGEQEDGRRAGTENVAGVLSMIAAWDERERQIQAGAVAARLEIQNRFIARLREAVPEVEIVGASAPRLWNTVAALMPLIADCRRRWVVQLDKMGFAASTGSACASGKEKASHVLSAMGYGDSESDRMIRYSSGWDTSEQDWDALLEAIRSSVTHGAFHPVKPGIASS